MRENYLLETIQKDITEKLNSEYVILNPHFHNVNLAEIKYSVSNFYHMFDINNSKMTNTWKLLAQPDDGIYHDFRIGQKIVTDIVNQYSVLVDEGCHLVRNSEVEPFKEEISEAISAFIQYVVGEKSFKFGKYSIDNPLNIEQCIDISLSELKNNLEAVCKRDEGIREFVKTTKSMYLYISREHDITEIGNHYTEFIKRYDENKEPYYVMEDDIKINEKIHTVVDSYVNYKFEIAKKIMTNPADIIGVTWDYFSFRPEHITENFVTRLSSFTKKDSLHPEKKLLIFSSELDESINSFLELCSPDPLILQTSFI